MTALELDFTFLLQLSNKFLIQHVSVLITVLHTGLGSVPSPGRDSRFLCLLLQDFLFLLRNLLRDLLLWWLFHHNRGCLWHGRLSRGDSRVRVHDLGHILVKL